MRAVMILVVVIAGTGCGEDAPVDLSASCIEAGAVRAYACVRAGTEEIVWTPSGGGENPVRSLCEITLILRAQCPTGAADASGCWISNCGLDTSAAPMCTAVGPGGIECSDGSEPACREFDMAGRMATCEAALDDCPALRETVFPVAAEHEVNCDGVAL